MSADGERGRRGARGLVAVVASGGLSAGLGLALRSPGVALLPDEELRLVAILGALGLAMGAAAAAASGARTVASAVLAASAGPLALWGAALAPRIGRVVPRVQDEVLVVLGLAALGLALLGRTRAGPWAAAGAALALGLALASGRPPSAPDAAGGGRDLVVLTLDTVRADALALDAPGAAVRAHTPALNRLMASSRVFSNAMSPAALTGPAHAALWSGSTGVLDAVPVNGVAVPDATPWLPERLQAAGWHTMAAVSASVLDVELGFCRGFSRCDTTPGARLARASPALGALGRRSHAGSAHRRPDAETVALARHLWRSAPDRPRLLWVHLYGMHLPYESPTGPDFSPGPLPSLRGEPWTADELARGRAAYQAQVSALDAHIGALLSAVGDDAVLVVVGDHGESLGEHGYAFGHGRLAFSADVHVPMLVRAPGLAPGVETGLVGLTDLAPAIEAWAGSSQEGAPLALAAPPADRVLLSRTWKRSQPGGDHDLGPLAAVAARRGHLTVAVSRWHELAAYDRALDPLELAATPPGGPEAPLVAAVRRAIAAAQQAPETEPSSREALEALGYVDPGEEDPARQDPSAAQPRSSP